MTLYQQLQSSGNPQAAVQAVITLLENHTPQEVARILGISPRWVYTLRKRYQEGNGDLRACIRKRGPRNPMPNRTPLHLEHLVVRTAESTNFGPQRLHRILKRNLQIAIPPATIRNILCRHEVRCKRYRTASGGKRYRVNLEAFAPLEFWQIDTKDIADQKALPQEAYAAIFQKKLPRYQFTAAEPEPVSGASPLLPIVTF